MTSPGFEPELRLPGSGPIEIELDYEPRAPQWELHNAVMGRGGSKQYRHVMCVWHRRSGKTVGWLQQLQRSALTDPRGDGRYAYIAPFYRQAKTIAWDYLKAFAAQIPGTEPHEAELRIDYPNGSRVQLFGGDNPDRLRGIYLDGVALDEYGQISPRLRSDVLIPALTDRNGYEIVGGTPQGRNAFYSLYNRACADPERWWVSLKPASQTGILSAEQLEEARREMQDEVRGSGTDEDIFAQEFECSWAAGARGAYYAKLIERARSEDRIGVVPHEPQLPVITGWDLGVNDSMSIWFAQQAAREIRLIDHYENSGEGLSFYAKILDEKATKLGYRYSDHIAPFDIDVREIGTGKSRLEVARGMGINFRIAPKLEVADGIELVRNMLPRCYIDAKKCTFGIDAISSYKREFDEKRQVFRDTPLHDWSSHAADALRTLASGWRNTLRQAPPRKQDLSWMA